MPLFIVHILQNLFHEWMKRHEMRKDRDVVEKYHVASIVGITNSMEIYQQESAE